MISLLFKFIMSLIGKLADLLMTPIIAGISTFIPSISTFLNMILQFFQSAFQFIGFWLSFLMVPEICTTLIYDVLVATLLIHSFVIAYQFVVKIYNVFKP